MNVSLHFDKGTILLYGREDSQLTLLKSVVWDDRTQCYRAPAADYRRLVTTLREQKIPFQDHARKFSVETFPLKKKCKFRVLCPRFCSKKNSHFRGL